MKYFLYFVMFLTLNEVLLAKVIEVCPSCHHTRLLSAVQEVQPGDTILIRSGVYTTSEFINNLQGTSDKWITITASPGEEVILRGQSEAIHLTDPAYLEISNLIFEEQTANGVNIDDGGSYDTPARHIKILNCQWRNMNATGNNDMLKLSGVDNFYISNCTFINGSAGGSGIDMVGCHNGIIEKCKFENQGSNSIQTKGGSQNIVIQKNTFINGGLRTLNIGGSTGLQYFRPIDAIFEASQIYVYSNIFIGSQAPIAFVGAVDCEVVNNTIFLPTKWAIRILQENTLDRFQKCGRNKFVNNIVYVNNNASNPTINIGPNTEPETFSFSNNLWYNKDNSNWNGPNLPVSESNGLVNIDPMISQENEKMLLIDKNSPAKRRGLNVEEPKEDFFGNMFNNPRSVGAVEVDPPTSEVYNINNSSKIMIYPNPAKNYILVSIPNEYFKFNPISLAVYNSFGECIWKSSIENLYSNFLINVSEFPTGIYLLKTFNEAIKFLILR
ncbi:T9SS C-terminal target domain-containing protein [Bacteroidetes/Chlorobi group bacterium Naka2016]|jgi:hypothetical protein|nr:MAG: T9SS C-terminal target domain-containing protein [Bacteroidetes/Chlorobi group bacterium Naka2016]